MRKSGIYAEFWDVCIESETKELIEFVLKDRRLVPGTYKPRFAVFFVKCDQDGGQDGGLLCDTKSTGMACTTVSALEKASQDNFTSEVRFELSVYTPGDVEGEVEFLGTFGPGTNPKSQFMLRSSRLTFLKHHELNYEEFKGMPFGPMYLERKLQGLSKKFLKMQECGIEAC